MGFVYLACPCHHPNTDVERYRRMKVTQIAASLIRKGVTVYSPLTHSAEMLNMPFGWEFWEQHDREFLERADALYVLCLPQWGDSVGVRNEISIAQMLDLPILYLDSNGIPYDFVWDEGYGAIELGITL